MPPLRAIGHLLPLRSPIRAPNGEERPKNLLDHHQFHHPHEAYLNPITHERRPNIHIGGYEFYGRFIEAASSKDIAGGLLELKPTRISEVAALALEQTFGKSDTLDETFTVPWGMPESRREGRVFWDTSNDRIIAKTQEGFILALEGTNVVEAAVYLPRIYEELKLRLAQGTPPEGIDIVEIRIEGSEEWSVAASPLHIKCRAPNLESVDLFTLDRALQNTLQNAIDNRRNS